MREWSEHYPETDSEWYKASNYLALLSVANEDKLLSLLLKAEKRGIQTACFREPDLDNAITAIVLEPGVDSKRICGNIRLMGS
jgi:hypothetical protein